MMVCVEYDQCLEMRRKEKATLDAACVLGNKLRTWDYFPGSLA